MEDRNTRLKRLKLRSWRRGMKEMDLILGEFADKHLEKLSAEELDAHEQLMDQPDQDLYAWMSGAQSVPERLSEAVERVMTSRKAD